MWVSRPGFTITASGSVGICSRCCCCLCCSVTQSCPTLCDTMDCITADFPVLHHLSEFSQTPMSIESMMPSNYPILCHPLSSCLQSFPASGSFSSESVLRITWPKYWPRAGLKLISDQDPSPDHVCSRLFCFLSGILSSSPGHLFISNKN